MKKIEIILLEKIASLGSIGEIVTVKAGYARNFLFPLKRAIFASPAAIERINRTREDLIAQYTKKQEEEKILHNLVDGRVLTITAKSDNNGKLYGSLSLNRICDLLNSNLSCNLRKKQLSLFVKEVKYIGEYNITVAINENLNAIVLLNVTRE
jgi:large subunit ribosomal protein L9